MEPDIDQSKTILVVADDIEARFHQKIAKLLSKRQQGYVMQAFREVFDGRLPPHPVWRRKF